MPGDCPQLPNSCLPVWFRDSDPRSTCDPLQLTTVLPIRITYAYINSRRKLPTRQSFTDYSTPPSHSTRKRHHSSLPTPAGPRYLYSAPQLSSPRRQPKTPHLDNPPLETLLPPRDHLTITDNPCRCGERRQWAKMIAHSHFNSRPRNHLRLGTGPNPA
jgi:hypothetical protein